MAAYGKLREDSQNLYMIFVQNISFNIISSSVDGDSAIVTTEITNINIGNIFGEFFVQAMTLAFESAFGGVEYSDEEIEQLLIDLLERPDNPTVTSTVDVNLAMGDTGWAIDVDDDFSDALFGGLVSAVESFNNF